MTIDMAPLVRRVMGVVTGMAVGLMVATAANANMDSIMDGMFQSTATHPQIYNSPTRIGASFGRFQVRTPVGNYKVANWDPPRISAGCSGISASMGAFTIMNAEQFKNMIKQIGANAGMYFLKLAIGAICNQCEAKIAALAEQLDKWNLNNINTCEIGKSIATGFYESESVTQGVAKASQMTASVLGLKDDPTEAREGADKGIKDPALQPFLPAGNLVWRVLKNKSAAQYLTSSSAAMGVSENTLIEYLMSMSGTKIIPTTDGYVELAGQNVCATGSSASDCLRDPFDKKRIEGFTINALLWGKSDLTYWKCDTTDDELSCQNPSEAPLQLKGAVALIHKRLFGNDDQYDYQPTSDSLLGNLINGTDLTQEQLRILAALPKDFIASLLSTQKNKDAMANIAIAYRDVLAMDFARKLGSALVHAYDMAFSAPSTKTAQTEKNIPEPEKSAEAMEILRYELGAMDKDYFQRLAQASQVANVQLAMMNDHKNLFYWR